MSRHQHIKWRQQWDTETDAEISAMTAIDFTGTVSMTDPSHAEDSDINVIMRRFGVQDGSKLPYWPAANGIYGDISEFPNDPTEVANILADAKIRFMELPASVRQRFSDPEALFAFMDDDRNLDEARRLGLIAPPVTVEETPPKPAGKTSSKEDKG